MRRGNATALCVLLVLMATSVGISDPTEALWDTVYTDIAVPIEPLSSETGEPTLLIPGAQLVRTPREYASITVVLRALEPATATLLIDELFTDSVRRSRPCVLPAGERDEIKVNLRPRSRPSAMLSDIAIEVTEGVVAVERIAIGTIAEMRPKPHVTVTGPKTGASVQDALNRLPEEGGVVYIPAGEYIFENQVTIPVGNVSIYGDGVHTVLQGTWHDAVAILIAEGVSNLRISRLRLRSLPITHFRGYSEARYARVPEDAGRASVISRGIELRDCSHTRIDHCEIELFGHAGVIFYGGHDNLVDHCFFHENFRYGYGYGVATPGTSGLYIEDNNFENHRHGIAGNAGGASYVARYNRLVKDASVFDAWQQSPDGIRQLRGHEIDAHPNCGWVFAHNNYVEMIGALMGAGAMMRGNPGWIYDNVFVCCSPGIMCVGDSDDVWTWGNTFRDCPVETHSTASGAIHFGRRPADYEPFPYPHERNRPGWWPGRGEQPLTKSDPQSCFAGPQNTRPFR